MFVCVCVCEERERERIVHSVFTCLHSVSPIGHKWHILSYSFNKTTRECGLKSNGILWE